MALDFCFDEDRYLLVGEIRKPHGLRGEVKVSAYSGDSGTLLNYSRVVLVDKRKNVSPALTIEKARIQGKGAILKLETVNDRERAEALYGFGILIDKSDLPLLDADEYYWHHLYNRPVCTQSGEDLGTVASIFSNGAQDIMVVKNGKREFLIPLIDAIVIDDTEERIIVSPPPGLLEINSGTAE
ncbi:MAG: ribosome maturation factor RimM [Desulfopila sp.]|jgi:16S rRNA processing protein RimM|nr:ribosome maturation factor RimM [Desulfopila sp.]